MLDAFERALADLPDATLTMIFGTSELFDEVARADRAIARVERDRVRLAGAVPHDRMAAFFSAADLFVVGSHHEGSGYSLMEACACGAMPVVTGIPTFRLLTGNGSIGALWTTGDAADWRARDRHVGAPRSRRGARASRGSFRARVELGRGRPTGDGDLRGRAC